MKHTFEDTYKNQQIRILIETAFSSLHVWIGNKIHLNENPKSLW